MRRKSFVFLMAFLVLCTGALMVACPPPGGPHLTKASLRIHIGNNIVARTIAPPSDATTVASYSVSGNGPNGASFGPLPVTGDSATVDGLAFGSWTVKVDALNAKGDIIGHGESSTTVASGDNSVTVSVLLASGWGSLSLTVTWKTSQVQGPGSVSASITSATGGSALPLTPFTGATGLSPQLPPGCRPATTS